MSAETMASEKSVIAVIRASRPSFRNNRDKVAFAVHASFLASGYALTATGPPAFSNNVLSAPSSDEVGIDHWNELDDDYAFVYVNPEKDSKKVLVKCLVMNDKLLVDALAEGGTEPVHLEINIGDYVEEYQGTNYSAHYKNLENLIKSLDKEILSKLQNSDKPSSSKTREAPSNNQNDPDVVVAEPPGTQPFPSRLVYPPVPVNPIGGNDLFPSSPAGVYRDDFGRGGGGGIGGGMLWGPRDPRWNDMVGREPDFLGVPRPLGVPPGARYDPIGPPDVPGFEPNRFVRNPLRRPGRPGSHPDLEHFGGGNDFI